MLAGKVGGVAEDVFRRATDLHFVLNYGPFTRCSERASASTAAAALVSGSLR
jgi:hypothetical protein